MTKKEMRERQRVLVEEARAKLAEVESATDAARVAEVESQYDAVMAEHDEIDGQIERLDASEARQARLAEAEERGDSRRPRGGDARSDDDRSGDGGDAAADAAQEYRSAFGSYLSGGMADLSREHRQLIRERRSQVVGSDTQGGFLVPEGFISELVTTMAAHSPMFDESVTRQIVTASGNPLLMPTEDDTGNEAVLVTETEEPGDEDLLVGQIAFGAFKFSAKGIKCSAEFIQDSAINAEQWVRAAMAKRFSRGIGRSLTTGTGVGEPQGIVTAAGAGITAAAQEAISFDELIDLQHAVDPAYRAAPTSAWMFHDATLKLLRKVKDADGNFIWQPASAQTGAPAQLLNHPYRINQAMAVPAAGARSVLFGDLDKFAVRRVREVSVRRLDELYAASDQVGFIGFARVDGRMLDPAAIKVLEQAA